NRLTLTGKVSSRERKFVYDNLRFPEKQNDSEFLPHLWSMRRFGYLLDQIRLNGESKELRDEVVELGTRYGIVTPYTSYLVLEPGERGRMLGQSCGGIGGVAGTKRSLSKYGPEDVFGTGPQPASTP